MMGCCDCDVIARWGAMVGDGARWVRDGARCRVTDAMGLRGVA